MITLSRCRLPLAAGATVVALAGCGSSGSTQSQLAGSTASPSRASTSSGLKVAIVSGETGSQAQIGQAFVANAKLGAATINEQLEKAGLSAKYRVTITGVSDTQGQAQQAIAACRQAVDVDGSDAIVGDYASSTTIACAQSVTIPKGIPVFTGGSSPAVTLLPQTNLIWRTLPSDGYGGQVTAQYLAQKFGKGATINLSYENDAFGQALQQVVSDGLKKRGLKVGASVALNPTAPSFSAEAQQLTSNHPSGWYNIIFCAEWGKLRPQLEQTGAWSPTKTVNSAESDQCPKPTELNAGITGIQSQTTGGDGYSAYLAAYKTGSGGVSNQESTVPAFDAVYLAFLAAVAAKTDDPSVWKNDVRAISGPAGEAFDWQQVPQMIRALQGGQTIDYHGVSAQFDFTTHGDPGTAVFGIWKADGAGARSIVAKIKPDALVSSAG